MKRIVLAVVLGALVSTPARAEDARHGIVGYGVTADGSASHLDLGPVVLARAFQVSSQQQAPAPPGPGRHVGSGSVKSKALYFATLAGAVAGMAFNVKTTRDALDHHLEARTFPLVWQKTRDPADKGKVSGVIVGANGALLGLGAVFYARGDRPLGTFVNVLVAGATTIIGLHNQSIINDCTPATCQ
jgi:hypothetical protein